MTADAELLVRDWLDSTFADTRVVTELPSALVEACPVIRVSRIGGFHRPGAVLDNALLDVEYFALGRDAARKGAIAMGDAFLEQLPGSSLDGAVAQNVVEFQAPIWVPYDNTNVRRFLATYQVTVRTIRSTG